jgi:hypothetical protein
MESIPILSGVACLRWVTVKGADILGWSSSLVAIEAELCVCSTRSSSNAELVVCGTISGLDDTHWRTRARALAAYAAGSLLQCCHKGDVIAKPPGGKQGATPLTSNASTSKIECGFTSGILDPAGTQTRCPSTPWQCQRGLTGNEHLLNLHHYLGSQGNGYDNR